MASTYLTRTPSSTGNRKILTISCWFKRSNVSSTQTLFANGGNSYNRDYISLESNQLVVARYDSAYIYQIKLNRVFTDTSSWYHLVVAFDTSEDSSDNRIKIYINGVRETSFATNTRPALNVDTWYNYAGYLQNIGVDYDNAGNDFNGLMSYVALVDGKAELPTIFGETDSATGQWKIKTSITPSSGWGTNGFLILKNGNSVTDQSGNSNNFTVGGGTLTKTEDNPSNVFATLNPLHIQGNTNRAITYGNTRFYTTSNAWGSILSTLGFSSGKFYVEAKILGLDSSTGYGSIAIQDINAFGSSGNTDANLMGNNASAGLGLDYRSGESSLKASNVTVSSNVANFSDNDIIGMAIDMDNKALYIHKNGTYYQIGGVTGVPTSGASKTGAITIPTSIKTCAIGMGGYSGNADFCYNFGNGYFISTAVSSAGTNASGNGIFEYDVPTGYTALSTKGLNL